MIAEYVRLRINTPSGDVQEIDAPLDLRVSDFIEELKPAMRLATADPEGRPIVWRLDNKDTGRTLEHEMTLEQNGVQPNHRLILLRATTAGA